MDEATKFYAAVNLRVPKELADKINDAYKAKGEELTLGRACLDSLARMYGVKSS